MKSENEEITNDENRPQKRRRQNKQFMYFIYILGEYKKLYNILHMSYKI